MAGIVNPAAAVLQSVFLTGARPMPAQPTSNPFAQQREARSVTVTFRMTPTEHQAVKAIADREAVEIVDLIREGLGLVVDRRRQTGTRSRR
jgi:hypothetical protein